ncbi:uncharacterized protein CEXT_16571 [Caerostris extrusa]|uniref:Uncharacterized protein n=1 Tax=Caerostris extrusa TaxID=172846 RepID=A0AAV4RSU2_CAEEX|nr:uncharacterized protein CEXT_16571 [Caerostris extrusa]
MVYLLAFACALIKTVSCQYQMPYPSSTKPTQPTAVKKCLPSCTLALREYRARIRRQLQIWLRYRKRTSGAKFQRKIRLADGTISGTYGVVDELGHKRVVHYSSGKTGFFSQEEPVSKAPKDISSTTSAPQLNSLGFPT